jgi:prepilin-type N-terminal cleavage/methylation domain-containing protein
MTRNGFTLVEVLVALGLFVVIATGVAQLTALATRAMRSSREQTMAVMLAAGKMDQLRALEWAYEPSLPGDPLVERTDLSTNLASPGLDTGGAGLRASAAGSLAANVAPFVDYLDERGRWVGAGSSPPPDAVFIRRWAIRPLAAAPDRSLLMQVLVITIRDERSRAGPWSARSGGDALLTSIRTRMRR